MGMILKNKKFEILFLIFPFWIPLLYFGLINAFPSSRIQIFTLFVLILGETHFAATWLFFTLPANREWSRRNWKTIYMLPIIILIPYFCFSFAFPNYGAVLGSIFSSVHVTRQSIGVIRLYRSKRNGFEEKSIYFFSAIFIIIGGLRFIAPNHLNGLLNISNLQINFFVKVLCIICTLVVIQIFLKTQSLELKLATVTGILLYSPYLVVSDASDAVAMGVGMHWCQYLTLIYKIYLDSKSKNSVDIQDERYFAKKVNSRFIKILFISIYAIFTTSIITKLGTTFQWKASVLALPLSLQAFHYYLDAFIWKFSDPDIRVNIGSRLFKSKSQKIN